MDKFLNLCFKFGKWFMAFVLVILLIAGIYLGVQAVKSDLRADTYKMDYKMSEEGIASLVKQKDPTKKESTKKDSYNDEIVKLTIKAKSILTEAKNEGIKLNYQITLPNAEVDSYRDIITLKKRN